MSKKHHFSSDYFNRICLYRKVIPVCEPSFRGIKYFQGKNMAVLSEKDGSISIDGCGSFERNTAVFFNFLSINKKGKYGNCYTSMQLNKLTYILSDKTLRFLREQPSSVKIILTLFPYRNEQIIDLQSIKKTKYTPTLRRRLHSDTSQLFVNRKFSIGLNRIYI